MPFGDDDVQINYQAVVSGMENVAALREQTQGIQGDTQNYTKKVEEATVAHTKHRNALLQTHTELRQFRREIFLFGFAVGITTAVLNSMATGSEAAQGALEGLKRTMTNFGGAIGNWVNWWTQAEKAMAQYVIDRAKGMTHEQALLDSYGNMQKNLAQKSADTRIKSNQEMAKLYSEEAHLHQLRGEDILALESKKNAQLASLNAEQIAVESEGDTRLKAIKENSIAKRKQYAEEEYQIEKHALELHKLGLKERWEIDQEFQKSVVSGAQGDTSDTIFKFLQGEKQTGKDIIKSFQATFNRAFSDAISQSFFTAMKEGTGLGGFFKGIGDMFGFGKKAEDPHLAAQKETNRVLHDQDQILAAIRDCVCRTAAATEAVAACGCGDSQARIVSMTTTPAKQSTLSQLAAVTGAISSIAGLAGGIAGAIPSGGNVTPIDPGMMPPAGNASMAGMMTAPEFHPQLTVDVPHFPSGGEVPVTAQPGEFIVRKSAAQDNKDLLKGINSGARQSKGSQAVFFINANDAKSFSDMLASPSAREQMEMQIIKKIMSNGSLRDAIRSYGRG